MMKRQFISVLFSGFLLVGSCNKDNSNNNNNPSSGTWRVTLFTDSGNDETSDFSGYTFTFASSGVLTAAKSGVDQPGTWSQTSSDFNIDLGVKSDSNKPLGELTDNWDIISVSANEIKLQDNNSASGEFLTFTKN